MGAVVLEIFQGKHFGSIFGTIMLAALAGGAAGPWVTGVLHDLSRELYARLRDRYCRERAIGGGNLAGFAGQGARGRGPVAPDARTRQRETRLQPWFTGLPTPAACGLNPLVE